MSATNAFETALLNLILANVNAANVGDATGLRGSSTAGVVYVSLHTADPGEGGAQNTTEAAYTGYARQSVVRSAAGWTVSGNNASNAALISFPNCSASPGSPLTHFGIGSDVSGAGNLFFKGALGASYQPAIGNAPTIPIGDLDVNAD